MDQKSDVQDLALPKGVTIRKHRSGDRSIQIAFSYQGHQCRESLRNRMPNRSNIRFAGDLVARIRSEIAQGTFDYLKYFPSSRRAQGILGRGTTYTVSELLDDFMANAEKDLAPSTMRASRSMIDERIKPGIGHLRVRDLTTSQIVALLSSSQMQNLSLKYVRNVVTPLRRALFQAVHAGYRADNPAASKSLSVKDCVPKAHWKTGFEADPFNDAEIAAILAACESPAARHFFAVAFATGLRTGEMIALKWRNVDFHKRVLTVERAIVEGYEKSTKTVAGHRVVELSDEAIDALKDQQEITGERTRVFCEPRTTLPLRNSHEIYNLWQPAIRRAQVRYRCPMQTRHTFASRMISNQGINLFWLAKQMGHRGVQMLNQHYARWIEGNAAYASGSGGAVGSSAKMTDCNAST